MRFRAIVCGIAVTWAGVMWAGTGRPDRSMPPFPNLTEAQHADLAAFYHSEIFNAANRRLYKVGDILVGDARAGEAFFSGAGKCTACHSAAGDL